MLNVHVMKALVAALFLALLALPMLSQETAKPITVSVEPLGDSDGGVTSRVTFRFAHQPDVEEGTPLVLLGSYIVEGAVVRNFRYSLPSDHANAFSTIQTLAAGELEVEVRLMPADASAPIILAKTTERFTIAPTGQPFVAGVDAGADAIIAEGVGPQSAGAVTMKPPRRDVALNLFIVDVDVAPPVTRVEFWVDGKKIIARNAPPYTAELDLGKLPKRVEVKAVGYDRRGRYIDADAFVVNERETPLEVRITRTQTPDGTTHFKLSVQNPKAIAIRSVALYAGDQKLREWTQPPYALSIPTARLEGVDFVRAAAIDANGYEASDLQFLDGERFVEEIEVNVVELPISVTSETGASITGLQKPEFTVLENGAQQTISSFDFASNLPISVGVLIDHSGSMQKRMGEAKKAAVDFFRSIIGSRDRAFVAAFASDPTKFAPFVSDVATLESQVGEIPDALGGTALYDAIVTGLYRFRNVQGRKALIVITDGEDTTSRLPYDDMLTYARAARVPLYFIGIGMRSFSLGGSGTMKSLAAETGGVAYFIRDVELLGETYKTLERELRSQYLITYHAQSSAKDREYRTVEVKVARPGATVRTIRGYIP